ncbi:unnamed protein product [Coccothraustes coccothraustes]
MTRIPSWTQSPSRGKRFRIAQGTIPGRNREFSPFFPAIFWLSPFPCGFQRDPSRDERFRRAESRRLSPKIDDFRRGAESRRVYTK